MFNEVVLPKEWDVESDIVIIGAGTAGLCAAIEARNCLLYTSPSPRDVEESRMPSSA